MIKPSTTTAIRALPPKKARMVSSRVSPKKRVRAFWMTKGFGGGGKTGAVNMRGDGSGEIYGVSGTTGPN